MMSHPGFTCVLTIATLLFGAGPLRAQELASKSRHERSGFYFGFGFGPGNLSVGGHHGGTDGGLSTMLRIGSAVNQHVLIGVQINGWIKAELVDQAFGTITGTVTLYPSSTSGFFLTGGVGAGGEINGEGIGSGLGGLLGVGYDVRVTENISFTPFVNGFTSTIEDSYNWQGPVSYDLAQIGVGLTFH